MREAAMAIGSAIRRPLAHAEQWQSLGISTAGEHFVDLDSLQPNADHSSFSIVTNVIQPDKSAWLTLMEINCQHNTFTYLEGIKMQDDNILSRFNMPRPIENISEESMPAMLKQAYCDADPDAAPLWESIGKSAIAEVFFDHDSVKQSQDGERFIATTKVVPLKGQEQTFSNMLFNCKDDTFVVLKLSRLKNGKLETVFDKPQPTTPTSKTATLKTLARRYCGHPAGR